MKVEAEGLVCDKDMLGGWRDAPACKLRCSGNIVGMLLMCKAEVLHEGKKQKKKTTQGPLRCVFSNHIFHSATYFSDDHQLHSLVNVWWWDLCIPALDRRCWAPSHAVTAVSWIVWINFSSRLFHFRGKTHSSVGQDEEKKIIGNNKWASSMLDVFFFFSPCAHD